MKPITAADGTTPITAVDGVTPITAYSNDVAVALAQVALAASGSEEFSGTVTSTLPGVALAAAGTEAFTGSVALTTPAIDVAAAGSATSTGVGGHPGWRFIPVPEDNTAKLAAEAARAERKRKAAKRLIERQAATLIAQKQLAHERTEEEWLLGLISDIEYLEAA